MLGVAGPRPFVVRSTRVPSSVELADDFLEIERISLRERRAHERGRRRGSRRHPARPRAVPRPARDRAIPARGFLARAPEPHVGRTSSSSGRAGQTTSSGASAVQSTTASSKSRSTGSAQWMSSTMTTSGLTPGDDFQCPTDRPADVVADHGTARCAQERREDSATRSTCGDPRTSSQDGRRTSGDHHARRCRPRRAAPRRSASR